MLMVLYSCNSISQSGYLCIPDLATGFAYQKNIDKWVTTKFNVSGEKYLLTKNNKGIWEWRNFGEKSPGIYCEEDFNEYGYISCSGFSQISFNNKNLRFLKIYKIGYVNKGIAGKEGEDTPSMEIGTCTPL